MRMAQIVMSKKAGTNRRGVFFLSFFLILLLILRIYK